jgi:hypothetical protein
MTLMRHFACTAVLVSAAIAPCALAAQSPPTTTPKTAVRASAQNIPLEHQPAPLLSLTPPVSSPLQPLLGFKDSDIKFNLGELMSTLRDSRHEGWVLAAYPDPKTSRPLIGAGFGLDIPARDHPQHDPLNPDRFLEPSSADLWQAAGLDQGRLDGILEKYYADLDTWQKTRFRTKIRTHALAPEITDDEATQLLRISAIQAIHNARAYCRNFDQLTAYQQMALSQLVFQMGVNLEEFTQFLAAINDSPIPEASLASSAPEQSAKHWRVVQANLVQSDWARRYSSRAISVIAMFDPQYDHDPSSAERQIRAEVRPLVTYRHGRRHAASMRTASARHSKKTLRRSRRS